MQKGIGIEKIKRELNKEEKEFVENWLTECKNDDHTDIVIENIERPVFKVLEKHYDSYDSDLLGMFVEGLNIAKNKELLQETLIKHGLEVRICSHCGKFMIEGFTIYNGEQYYCGEECLIKHFTVEEYLALYDDGDGTSFYYTWY